MGFTNPLMKLPFATRGWITLASGFVVHFTLGTFYLWGSIITYTTSYLQQTGSNVTKDDAGAVFPFTFLAINIGTAFGVDLAKKFGHFRYLFVTSFLCGLSVFISAYVVGTFGLFVLFYGVLFGLLCGIIYMVPFNTCYMYFPTRKGLVSGVITGGFGFGSAVFIWLIYGIVNSKGLTPTVPINGGKYYTTEVTDQYPSALRALGLVILGLGCLSSFFHLRPTVEEAKAEELRLIALAKGETKVASTDVEIGNVNRAATSDNEKNDGVQSQPEEVPSKEPRSEAHIAQIASPAANVAIAQSLPNKEGIIYYEFPNIKEGMQTSFIYISTLLAFLFTAYGTMIVSQYKNYGEYQGYSDTFLSTVGTVGSIMNGSSRIFWGAIFEKFTFMQLLTVNVVMQMIVSFTFRWVASSPVMFFIYIQLGYFLYGAWLAMCPAIIARIYGKKIGSTIYCFTFFGFVAASFLQFFLVKELKASIGWGDTFWAFTGIQLFGLIISYLIKQEAIPPSVRNQVKLDNVQTENAPLAITTN